MATCHWDGADDHIRGTGSTGAFNGTFTIAMLIQRDRAATFEALMSAYSTGGSVDVWEFMIFDTDSLAIFVESSDVEGASDVTATGNWFIVAITKTTGTTTPKFHYKDITSPASWIHENANGTIANSSVSAAGGHVQIGNWGTNSSALSEDYQGDIGLVGWWDGTSLSDGQIEELSTNSKTSDWYNNSAGTPTSLTQLNTITPTDLTGLMTWSTIVVTLTGGDPTGWTFDGTGVAPTAPTFRPGYARFPKPKLVRT